MNKQVVEELVKESRVPQPSVVLRLRLLTFPRRSCVCLPYTVNNHMQFDDYKVILYRQQDDSWVAEIPAISGCYALMPTREAALAELSAVFNLIAQEYRDKGLTLPSDTTEIVNA